jgi:hypothetical protein
MKEKLFFLMQLLNSLEEQLKINSPDSRRRSLEIQNEIKKTISELEW